jgi:uncharacterized membrane protein
MPEPSGSPRTVQDNIETIVRLEEDFLQSRSTIDRAADAFANFIGSMRFILLHLLFFILWFAWNSKWIPGVPAFDPYPFTLLTMIVSMEGVLLSTFVLMKQNRMSQRADQRSHLNLQIDLLAEKEITKIIQMLQTMTEKMGVAHEAVDAEVRELGQVTAVDRLAQELDKKLPNE